jgi:hypothetical protein
MSKLALSCILIVTVIGQIAQGQSRPATPAATTENAATLYRQAFTMLATLNDADDQRLGLCGTDGCWVVTTPLDRGTADLLSRQARCVALIRRAAELPEARWELGGDAQKMVDIANQLPRLSALMVLHARHELRDGQPERAVDDLMVAMTTSRHAAATQPTMVTKMAEIAAFRAPAEALAEQLPTLRKDVVASLPTRFEKLPRSATMEQLVRGEQDFAHATARRQGTVVVVAVAGLTNFYEALAKGAGLPPDEFARLVDEQVAKNSVNPFAGILGPSFKRSRETVALLEAKQAMLAAAIDIILKGDAAVATSKDPFGKGPFAFERTAKGFVLRSALMKDGKPITLRVGGL